MVADPPPNESEFADCGSAVVSLWAFLCTVPSIYQEVQGIVLSADFPSERRLFSLFRSIDWLDDNVASWRAVHEPSLLAPATEYFSMSVASESDKRYEILAVCFAIQIILRRLRIALDPLGSSYREVQAQEFAQRIMDLEKMAIKSNPRAALFMVLKMEIARATAVTKGEWEVQSLLDYRVGANGLIAPRIFKRWCQLKGRKV